MIAFFHNKAQCDQFAEAHFGGPVEPVRSQGAFSYTVIAGDGKVIVQFREKGSPLPDSDSQLFRVFAGAHPGIVVRHEYHATVGALKAYSMPRLQGDTVIEAWGSFELEPDRRLVLAEDLAKFYVRSLQVARDSINIGLEERGPIARSCLDRLDNLRGTLPDRLEPAIECVRNHMDAFFDPNTGYPLVPIHGDLSPLNILVNKDTGDLTGVVDTAELSFLPVGFDFYAIDNIVGEWSPEGWIEYDDALAVRDHFWTTLVSLAQLSDAEVENVKVAWLAGILFRYGTGVNAGFPGMLGLRNDSCEICIQILDGLLKAGWHAVPARDGSPIDEDWDHLREVVRRLLDSHNS